MRILIAEDDFTSRMVLASVLKGNGYDVIETTNGAEALAALTQPDAPELVVLDWVMPELNGIDVVRKVRTMQASRAPYIIMLTSKGDKADVIAGLGAGADEYLTKPFDAGELRLRVNVGRRMIELRNALAAKVDELRDSKLELEEAQRLAQVGSWWLDSRTNEVVITKELQRMFQLDPSLPTPNLTGFQTMFCADSWEELITCITLARTEGVPYELELEMIRPGNSRGWMLAHGEPVKDDRSNIIGLRGTAQDITSRKNAELERARLESQLQQAQKMESVGRLAGGVAHDFNNMLAVILGHSEMALDQVDASQPIHADLIEICRAAQRSADLTRQLLAFARKQTVVPRAVDLNDAVTSMLKMLQRLIGEDIHLDWRPEADVWDVKIDPSQLDQILANLCINSRDAITGIGRITIETENVVLDSAYCANTPGCAPGEYVLLAISDNGSGMDKHTLSRLFEPFFTTKVLGKGTGLGLATVYGIVKQNSGFISVNSEVDRGTTFRIYLPRYLGRSVQLGAETALEDALRGDETVLVVEDEPAILKMTSKMLKAQGYTVLTSGSPIDAIRLAQDHGGPIQLLLSDVIMPEMNGRDLTEALSVIYPGIKQLYMSGYTADVIAHHGVLEEGVHFIQKPFTTRDLALKVREALNAA